MKEKAIILKLKLPRKASLKSRKQIDLLFKRGYVHRAYPLLVKYGYNTEEGIDNHKLLFSAPKRNYKRAVDRNLIKRRIKEAYRIHQHVFSPKVNNGCLNIAFIYVGKEIVSFEIVEKAVLSTLQYLSKKYEGKEKK